MINIHPPPAHHFSHDSAIAPTNITSRVHIYLNDLWTNLVCRSMANFVRVQHVAPVSTLNYIISYNCLHYFERHNNGPTSHFDYAYSRRNFIRIVSDRIQN